MDIAIWIERKVRFPVPDMAGIVASLVGPLVIAIPSKINIGLHHVLPIYPFLIMFAAITVVYLFQWWPRYYRLSVTIGVVLLVWSAEPCIAASPDFLTYFNEIAAQHARNILMNSDLDWGQDYYKLEDRLKNEAPQSVHVD